MILVTPEEHELATVTETALDRIEEIMLTASDEQVEIPTTHTFMPGLYYRTARMAAGLMVLGHRHRGPTLNFLLRGSLEVVVNGVKTVMHAPAVLESAAGTRKLAHVLEDVEWVNVFPNFDNETDIDVLEERHLDKTPLAKKYEALWAARKTLENSPA
jgi:hypothetical protein